MNFPLAIISVLCARQLGNLFQTFRRIRENSQRLSMIQTLVQILLKLLLCAFHGNRTRNIAKENKESSSHIYVPVRDNLIFNFSSIILHFSFRLVLGISLINIK